MKKEKTVDEWCDVIVAYADRECLSPIRLLSLFDAALFALTPLHAHYGVPVYDARRDGLLIGVVSTLVQCYFSGETLDCHPPTSARQAARQIMRFAAANGITGATVEMLFDMSIMWMFWTTDRDDPLF